MNEFFKIYDKWMFKKGFKLEIYHSGINDYCLAIYLKSNETDPIIKIQDSDYELLFAKGQVVLKEWLLEYNEGY
ncbi:hypothetical protein LYSIN_01193 [Lysinibacillus sphaericus]|uniref:Uncharacterized protein n=1 Tax=Lysinibacillus sphaericus TaxID=1421 RepID=A0A2S5D008_LYSSH|nr:hypothetical protein [Lysinibacillus sphaericus]POZ56410.1 hypothetical protein LYSIN_01193 [Lysinibacillus sphaericus]